MMTEWRTETVEECLLRLSLGAVTKLQTQDYRPAGLYPIIDQGQALIAGWTDDDRGLIVTDLPVIVFGDHTRVLKYVDFPFVRGADGTQILKPKAGIDPLFFYYACRAIDLPSRGYNRHFKVLKEQQIPIPPAEEQRAIALALKLVDDALSLQDEELRVSENTKRAAMRALLARGLRGEPQKETEIGPLPESWEITGFLDAFEIAQGQVDPKVEPFASMPHVGPENIEQGTGYLLPCTAARHLGLVSGKYLFKAGDILYSKIRPYLRKAALASFDGICSADMYPLTVAEGFDRYFLCFFLLSDLFTYQATPHQTRTGIPKINREQLATIKVPKPGLDEQRDIGAALAAIGRKIDLHRRKRAVLNELFKALLHQLMAAEIRVTDLDLSALALQHASEVAA